LVNWSKIKIIIFAAFLLINAFLIGTYIIHSKTSRALRAEVLAECGEILKSKNITVTADEFPIIPSHLPLYMSQNALDTKETIASHLLGSDNFMVEPNRFQNGDKELTVNGGHFSFYLTKIDQENLKLLGKPQAFWAKAGAKKAIKSANLWTGKTKTIKVQPDNSSNQTIVKLSDKIEGYPVVDSLLIVWCGTDETKDIADKTVITRIDGYNWLNTTYKKIPGISAGLKSITEILKDFAATHDASEVLVINNIEFGYIVGERAGDIIEKQVDIGIKITYDGGAFCISAIK